VLRRALGEFTILWLLALTVVVVSLTNSHFATAGNINSILQQSSYVGIVAAAMTLLLIAGDFDLSVGSMLAMCSVATASTVSGLGSVGALLAALATGVVLGCVNGTIVTLLKIPTLVATLGTMYIFLAVAFIVTDGVVKGVTDESFLLLAFAKVAGLPLAFVIMVGVFAIAGFLAHRTSYGRLVRAIGSNRRAALTAGVPVQRIRFLTFVLVGVCVGLAALLQTAQLSSATPTVGTGFELTVIATVILGGTALSGGRGTLFGSFCATLFFAVLNNALNLYGVGSYWQYVAVGAVIVTALALDSARARLFRATE
jgi:ribose/xylose/arabinose/galactoside ABC-type transport system permease subunit